MCKKFFEYDVASTWYDFFSKITNSENEDFESLINNQKTSHMYDHVEICYEPTLFEMQKCFGQGKSHSTTFLNWFKF